MNVRDGRLPSSVIVGMFPLNVVQENMPTSTGVAGTTDAGTAYVRENIPSNGVAYITGQPAAPQLTAQFKGLPEWMDVIWSGSLTTERSERNALDNRVMRSKTTFGDEVCSITESLDNEIVGGAVELQAEVAGLTPLNYQFNPYGSAQILVMEFDGNRLHTHAYTNLLSEQDRRNCPPKDRYRLKDGQQSFDEWEGEMNAKYGFAPPKDFRDQVSLLSFHHLERLPCLEYPEDLAASE